LILDKHPSEAKYWIAGGGSGHGYKLGAAVGERLSEMVLGKRAIDPFFSLARFKK
jgi:glycine/D-amino acid oxidase-like deaminating enzyme